MTEFDVCIFSSQSRGLFLAQKLKAQGLKVAWVPEQEGIITSYYQPAFLGIHLDLLDSAEYQIVSKTYQLIKCLPGLSLLTEQGPFDLGHQDLLEFQRHSLGYDPAGFNLKLQTWVDEAMETTRTLKLRAGGVKSLVNHLGSFSALYPKETLETKLTQDLGLQVLPLPGAIKSQRGLWRLGDDWARVCVWAGHQSSLLKRYYHSDLQPRLGWYRMRIRVGKLWSERPELPSWSLWREDSQPLPFYNAQFILQRVADDYTQADVYFRLPSSMQAETEIHFVCHQIITQIEQRLSYAQLKFLSFERIGFPVWEPGGNRALVRPKKSGMFVTHPSLSGGYSINHQIVAERALVHDIQMYLKKIEMRKVPS